MNAAIMAQTACLGAFCQRGDNAAAIAIAAGVAALCCLIKFAAKRAARR